MNASEIEEHGCRSNQRFRFEQPAFAAKISSKSLNWCDAGFVKWHNFFDMLMIVLTNDQFLEQMDMGHHLHGSPR